MDGMQAQSRTILVARTLAVIAFFLFSMRPDMPSQSPTVPHGDTAGEPTAAPQGDAAGEPTAAQSDSPKYVLGAEVRQERAGKKRKFPWLLVGAGVVVVGGALFLLRDTLFAPGPNLDFLPLEFPFQNWHQVKRMAAFGVPNWSGSEPHNGIDLIVESPAVIVSPTAGTISEIKTKENPYSHPAGQLILGVDIYINRKRTVSLAIEPGTTSAALKAQQVAAILVKKGDRVQAGTVIGTLLVGEQGYCHLHYSLQDGAGHTDVCPYIHSSTAARAIFETLKNTLSNNHLPDGRICYGQ
jgi:murein DD-endopeptidase MepM/ murein hydrolase activator NlpD